MADGQVTRGNEIIKPNVRKVRRIGDNKVIGGFAGEQQRSAMMLFWWLYLMLMPCPSCFAGATADAFTLFERLEMQLEQHPGKMSSKMSASHCRVQAGELTSMHMAAAGQLTRAAVELAKSWRTDKFLRKLDVSLYSLLPSILSEAHVASMQL